MRKIRDALTLLIFLACLAICGAATVEIVRQGAKEPFAGVGAAEEAKDPQAELLAQLRRVMVEQRLADLSVDQQQQFVQRMDRQFTVPQDWRRQLGELDETEQALFEENLETLSRLWLTGKVDHYFRLPTSEQTAFLDAEIERGLKVAQSAKAYDEQQPGEAGAEFRNAGQYFQQIRAAFEKSPPEERRRMALFLFALQARWKDKWSEAPPSEADN